jgi:hypothetical protein
MPVPVGLAAVGVAKKAPKPSADNAGMYLLGGLALVWIVKNGIFDPLGNVFDFVGDAAGKVVYVGDELTGGIQGDPRTLSYWTEVDPPFTDVQIPLVNVKEENQSWIDYTTTVDFPGLPEYNVLDTPGKIKGLFGRVF